MPENISEDYAESFLERGIVSFYGIDDALTATEIAADIGVAWQQALPSPVLKLAESLERVGKHWMKPRPSNNSPRMVL